MTRLELSKELPHYRSMKGRLVLFVPGRPPEILGHYVLESTGYRLVKPCPI